MISTFHRKTQTNEAKNISDSLKKTKPEKDERSAKLNMDQTIEQKYFSHDCKIKNCIERGLKVAKNV